MNPLSKMFLLAAILYVSTAWGNPQAATTPPATKAPVATTPTFDPEHVLTALSIWAGRKIDSSNLHCEINGTTTRKDGSVVNNDVRIRDFFVKHALWSLSESEFKSQGLDCEGDKILSCRWWFGEKEGNPNSPAYSYSLVFPYDVKKKDVRGSAVQCIQVP